MNMRYDTLYKRKCQIGFLNLKKIQTLGMDGSEKKITNMVEAAAAKVVAAKARENDILLLLHRITASPTAFLLRLI